MLFDPILLFYGIVAQYSIKYYQYFLFGPEVALYRLFWGVLLVLYAAVAKLFSELVHELRGGQSAACGCWVDEHPPYERDKGPAATPAMLQR